METAETMEAARSIEAMRDAPASASPERGSTLLRGAVVALIGGAILLLLGSAYFATAAGINYPDQATVLGE